ncbi:MAG TPA: DUF4203 domain-containing protein [Natrialbaceae archaeon]|nr:DUF4203 domain-containing protein [Natrialbaceae archaeon]
MVGLVDVGLVLAGLVLAFAGVRVFDYAVTVWGFLFGASVGLGIVGGAQGAEIATGVPQGVGPIEGLVAIVVGGMLGIYLAWAAVKLLVLVPAFLLGASASAAVVGIQFQGTPDAFAVIVVVVGGVVGAAIAWRFFRVAVAVVTAAVGATMVTLSIDAAQLVTAVTTLEPDTFPTPELSAWFLGVFVLGLATQVGLLWTGADESGEGEDRDTEAKAA